MSTVEIRVRPVTRYVVTRYESHATGNGKGCASSASLGEFDNTENADRVAMAIKRTEPNARVVTSDGVVHDPVQTKYAVIGRTTGEIQAPVMYAYDNADILRVCQWFKDNQPDMEYQVFAQTPVTALWDPQPIVSSSLY